MTATRSAASSLQSIFRFASPVRSSSARQCPRCLRPFSSAGFYRQSSKRQLQTATVYRPQHLEGNFPPPPRNAGTPESSIAGGIPKVDQWPSPQSSTKPDTQAQHEIESSPAIEKDLRERNGQKTAAPNTSNPEKSTRPRKSKLRPRKAAMTLSSKAVSQLRDLLDQPEPKLIRVGVKNRGCSGLAYHLEYVDKPGAFDEAVEQDGVKVLIDSKALFSIIGSEMDWVEDKLNQRFIFKNPNISEYILRHAKDKD
ncbi:putative iron-sulfur cluster biosynthesis protein [Elsinoe australis]|uniref:Putative iron-sulfur cluster biosynthesis protein n=1 Tax=Elsinoe australis TaxID=40998 RepID=A0A4V6DUM8_9PEZI|nr:putative iron-sulfur cluster biosynthesis protein [Elsinoe australis]